MARTDPNDAPPDSAADLPYQGVGAELRAAREAAMQSVDLVASALRIRRPHIQAIEDGRFDDLPGQVYAVGFVRAYAEHLHLDADLVVERFQSEADGPSAKLELHFPEPAARRTRFDARALTLGLVIAIGAYGGWYYLQTRGQMPRELLATVPPNLMAIAEDAIIEPATEAPSDTPALPPPSAARDSFVGGLRPVVDPAVEEPVGAMGTETLAPSDVAVDRGSPVFRAFQNDAPVEPEEPTVDVETASVITALRDPDRRAPVADASAATRMPTEPHVLRPNGNSPSLQVTAPASTSEAAPPEDAIAALITSELETNDAAATTPDSDSELPPISETVGMAQPGDSVDDEPGRMTAITGALAETPDAPTLIENEVPGVPAAPSGEYEPHVYGQGNTDARIVVRARIQSWVQVEGSNNELLLTRVLNPGDMFLVPNRSDLHLVTGNAGGIDILVDGVLLPPLGPEGTVRRNVQLTPDALTGSDTVSSR